MLPVPSGRPEPRGQLLAQLGDNFGLAQAALAVGAHGHQRAAGRGVGPAHVGRKSHVVSQRTGSSIQAQELIVAARRVATGRGKVRAGSNAGRRRKAGGRRADGIVGIAAAASQQAQSSQAVGGQHHGRRFQYLPGSKAHLRTIDQTSHCRIEPHRARGQARSQLLRQLLHTQGRYGGLTGHKLLKHKLKEVAGRGELPVQENTAEKRLKKRVYHLLAPAVALQKAEGIGSGPGY